MKWLFLSLLLLLLIPGCKKTEESTTDAAHETEEAEKMKVETVQTADYSMNYIKFGKGERTLVILPGLSVQSVMGSAEAVKEAYQLLSDAFTVYLFDRRNELPESYPIDRMAEDTAEAIRTLGLKDICLFGTSQGGMIALKMTIDHPELVRKLVLGSSAACVTETGSRIVGEWIELAKEGKAEELYLSFGEAVYPKEIYEQSKDLLIAAAKTVTEQELQRFIVLAGGLKDFDVTDQLKKITCPVLAIGSEDDGVLGKDATLQIAECMKDQPGFEYYMYENFGHAAYDTAPDYKERLLQFFTK